MAKKDIPNVEFDAAKPDNSGIDIVTISSLKTRINEFDHNPENAHQVAFNMIVFYTAGVSKQLVDFVWHDVRENTVIHLSKGQINAFKFTEDLEGYILLFTENYLKKQVNSLPKNEIIRLFNSHLFSPIIQIPDDSIVKTYIELFYLEYSNFDEGHNQEQIYDSLYSIIFSKLEKLKEYQTFHIKRSEKLNLFLNFKTLLESNFNKCRNADFYAERLNITYKHLNTISKETISLTAKQFIDEFIILEAKRLLINSGIKSTELSYSLGFEEPTNFVKYFKKHTGFTPNQFKKSFQ